MLESLAAWVLRTYVGEYVENLNTDQLSIGYGTVDLHNLPLKKTALKGLELPLEVKSGFIGHLQLSIPLRRPKSEPWIVHINKLYLVAGPLQHSEYDEEKERERERARKKKRLDALEAQWLAARSENAGGGFWSGSWWPSLYSSFSTTIAENLQLVISDVHFRYEDGTTTDSLPFAFGITMAKLSAQSTNEVWNPEEIIENERTIKYKLIELQNMAIYWDTDVTLVGDLPSKDLESALERMINRNQGKAGFKKHQYILEPISAQAKMKRNSSALPLRSRQMPRFVVDVHVEKIPLSLEETQYKMLISLMEGFERHFRQCRYLKWRPKSPIKNNARKWWQFSITCILQSIQERNVRQTWGFAVKRAHDIVTYVDIYSKHLTDGTVEPYLKDGQQDIEDELSFDELVLLRSIAQKRAEHEISETLAEQGDKSHKLQQDEEGQVACDGEGRVGGWQGWLTGWYSWNGSVDSTDGSSVKREGEDALPPFIGELPTTKEEEEFLGELADGHLNESIFNRDQVFAHLNFRLGAGSFKLVNKKHSNLASHIATVLPVIELEFSDLRWDSEMRPRTSTWEFSMSLGALFVRDKLTQGTLFPTLVCPQGRESQRVYEAKKQGTLSRGTVGAVVMSAAGLGLNILQEMNEPVFEMKFESLPPANKAAYRLSVTTQPLDVVYNPCVLDHISEFFSHTSVEGTQALYIERQLREVARVRYEELKNQTRAELVQTLDAMMAGSDVGQSKRWEIQLDISAPRFLVPESFQDKKASVVLVDFGHLSFANTEALNGRGKTSEEQDSEDMEEDPFVTPPSTPPGEDDDVWSVTEDVMLVNDSTDALVNEISSESLIDRMYERYTLNLSDIQMVVCNVKDNWSEVANRPFVTSDVHVVDKFTITIQMERRLLFTADPQYPAVTLSAQLPNLVLHINEHKLLALTKCLKQLSRPNASVPVAPTVPEKERIVACSTPVPQVERVNSSIDDLYYSLYNSNVTIPEMLKESPTRTSTQSAVDITLEDRTKELMEESRMLLVQFCIDRVSLGVHSMGCLIAELQVLGVKANYMKRPYDSTTSFAVHGVHLVDAIQTFGPEYELLFSSCKPQVPQSSNSFTQSGSQKSFTETVSGAFSIVADLVRPGSKRKFQDSDASFSSEGTVIREEEDLITFDYQHFNADSPSTKSSNGHGMNLANLQFNTLNIIANQETLAALFQFFNTSFSTGDVTRNVAELRTTNEDEPDESRPPRPDEPWSDVTEVTASFKSIDILVIRSIKVNGMKSVRKVAEVSVSEVQLNASFAESHRIDGSLGGFRISDLTPEGSLHRSVCTCGSLSTGDLSLRQPSFLWSVPEDTQDGPNDQRAFTFTLLIPKKGGKCPGLIVEPSNDSNVDIAEITRNIQVNVHVASAQYTHTHRFLSELLLSAGDYAVYAAQFGESLRQAASSVAMGLVSKKRALAEGLDYLSSSFAKSGGQDERSLGSRQGSLFFENDSNILLDSCDFVDNVPVQTNRRVYCCITVDSPVVHLPKSSSSTEVLVAHLGKITIRNTHLMEVMEAESDTGHLTTVQFDTDRLFVEIKDMSLYCSLAELASSGRTSFSSNDRSFTSKNVINSSKSSSSHILHNTTFELIIDRRSEDVGHLGFPMNLKKPTIQISGKVATPFQLELSTYSYRQLLETIDNIGGSNEKMHVPPPAGMQLPSLATPSLSPSTLSPSSSTANLEACIPDKVLPDKRVSFVPNVEFGESVSKDLDDESTNDFELESEDATPVRALFEIPHLSIKLCGELNKVELEFVDIVFYDFSLSYEHTRPTVTLVDVSLGGLIVEDLLQESESPYRHLISSSAPRQYRLERSLSAYPSSLSSSCPVVSDAGLNQRFSSSLPHVLSLSPRQATYRSLAPLRPLLKNDKSSSMPSVFLPTESDASLDDTSSGAALIESKESNLVHVKVLLIDKKDEEFTTKYTSVNRFIEVHFNSLEANLNLQTWVIVLEFFGIGAPPQPGTSEPTSPVAASSTSVNWDTSYQSDSNMEVVDNTEEDSVNTDVKFQVSALTLILSKKRYPIARVKAFGLFTHINMHDGNFAAEGKLSSVSVTDMSPHGNLYREKFITFGEEALSFDFFKYGTPDPHLQRENDMRLTLRMSSVQYVHTKRFQTELVAFFQHYLQLQEVLGRMRAVSEGNEVSWMFSRGTRVALDIKAGNPVILVPRSAKSSHMLVADLGNLTVGNEFLWQGSSGTLGYSNARPRAQSQNDFGSNRSQHICLLESMHIELVDMDLFTAVRVATTNQPATSEFSYKSQGLKLLKEKCRLNLTVERNLDWAFSRAVPDFNFAGRLSSVCASLDYSQYCFILGMLGENLGEPLEEFERPSSVIQDPLGKPPETEEVWTSLRMRIDLVNVSVELLPVQLFERPEQSGDLSHLPSLAKVDFIKSKFEFESFSDWSKTIDLVSQEVIFEDTRQKGVDLDDFESCIFTEVLLPRRSQAESAEGYEESLQFEVHYRDTTKKTLLTFLFNHSRIMLITDYLLDLYNFIMCQMFKPNTDSSPKQEMPLHTQEDPSPIKIYETPPPSASGVASRCEVPPQPQAKKTFEMKLNISGTELVVLENVKTLDTHAVVLKVTSVLAWRPHLHTQKWLSCSVQSLEMFSCVLSCEEETALSIIDPTSALIELNNARRPKGRKTTGLLDIAEELLPSLEVTVQGPLTMRVSYNDYKLYLSILESVSKQLNRAIKSEVISGSKDEIPKHDFDAMSVKRLQELGFKESDCIKALQATSGRLEASATWLLENATPIHIANTVQQQEGLQGWQFAGFEVHAGTVCVCLIDDCGDSDIPLMEFSAQHLHFWHDLQSTGDGAAHCTLVVQYYNRNVSDWEPFVEPWKCTLHWQEQRKTPTSLARFLAKLDAPDRLDVTVTSTLISMINHTIASWSEDYYRPDPSPVTAVPSSEAPSPPSVPSSVSDGKLDNLDGSISIDSPLSSPTSRPESSTSLWSSGCGFPRRRSPFVPFVLRNQTGCVVWFKTVTTTPSKVILASTGQALPGLPGSGSGKMSDWREVPSGGEAPFEFSSGEKQRHKETHELNIHQVIVQVDGWAALSPVSVDRVGTFFRQARPQKGETTSMVSDLQASRVVFDVSLEGRARKLVTLRSALMIKNKMDLPVEVKLQGLTPLHGALILPVLQPQSSVAIPLRCISWHLYVRPCGVGVGFCSLPIEWRSVLRSHTTMGLGRECFPVSSTGQPAKKFRFCVAVKREGYPEEAPLLETTATKELHMMSQPAHTLTIMYPVMLVNLLPCDLSYQVKNIPAKGNIKAGKSVPLYTADPEKSLDLGISIENFTYCDNIRISRRLSIVEQPIIHVELQDTKRRSLIVNVKISVKPGGSIRISIYAPYWMINSTGIPLIFKQEAVPHDMAGQFDEHEMARSLTPLLFSFSDREAPTRCQMRIGRGYQPGSGKPVWSNSFSLDSPREFKRVHARQGGSRPDKVYDIGIDVRFGKGRYRDTRIVTLATRYQLENRTPHTLAFSQRHFVREQGTQNPEGALTALPGALVLFHWSRTDLDQLLCIRLNDVSHCQWSGGFRIDRDDSFHINMRSLSGCSLFVRVEVMLKGATFYVLFTDASQLPPPFRIDNLSEVPITFFHSGTEDRLRTILQPKQSVPYSWDEPTLLPELSVGVMGSGSYMQYNMQDLGGGERIYYYNPIYIVFTHTFTSVDGQSCGSFHIEPATDATYETSLDLRELVLDVPRGSAVLLSTKEPHRRSQLWRMTSGGLLSHEGSSPPSVKPGPANAGLVLDIDSLAPPTCGKYVRLVLSKPNPRRLHSQTWSFTEDNRMKCDLPGLYVQPRGGVKGLRDGVDAVLGPANITKDDQIPIEQCISTCKLRPGSGCLGVQILADGPTRVLQITDCLQQSEEDAERDWMLVEQKGGLRQANASNLGTASDPSALEVQIRLVGGIGISVINSVPEELVFISLEHIELDFLRTSKLETLEASVGRIQIDNQLFASPLPVLLYPSFPERGSKEETMIQQPTLHLSAAKELSRLPNVEIFKSLDVSLRKMTLQLEEQLLLKLLQFFGYVQQDDDIAGSNEEQDECLYASQRPPVSSSTGSLKRYYFEHLQLNSTQLKLSVSSSGRLPEDLQSLKSSLGLIIVNLEDATIDLESFARSHPFDTLSSHLDAMSKHYIEEIRSQAAAIVASVNFLGNPMGLINDVSSGIHGLVKSGNVGGLFMNVAHGVSDSAAKITGSLSDGLWNFSMDSKNQENRDAMKAERFGSSKDHFVAGVKGLGMGLVGGLTSLVTQPIEGAHNSGMSGFITGLGKGIVGTIAQPTAGVLGFASGTAAAVRGQATRSSRYIQPKSTRLRRNCFGPSGAIPRFSATHAEGQEIMLKLNEGNFNEKFVLSESVRRDREDRLKAIVTTEGVYFVRARGIPSPESIVLLVRFSELYVCQLLSSDGKDYIELVMKADNSSVPTPSKNPSKRPRVRCDQQIVAHKVAQKINYAKNLYDEVQQTVKVEPKEPSTPV